MADGDELGQTVEQNRHKQLYTAIDILEGLKDKKKGGEKPLENQGDTQEIGKALQEAEMVKIDQAMAILFTQQKSEESIAQEHGAETDAKAKIMSKAFHSARQRKIKQAVTMLDGIKGQDIEEAMAVLEIMAVTSEESFVEEERKKTVGSVGVGPDEPNKGLERKQTIKQEQTDTFPGTHVLAITPIVSHDILNIIVAHLLVTKQKLQVFAC